MDPLAYHWWEVLCRYCREWFLMGSRTARPADVLPWRTLVGQMMAATARKAENATGEDSGNGKCKQPKEILDHVLEAVDMAGWVLQRPHIIVDCAGREIDLSAVPPAKIQQWYFNAVQQTQAN